MTIRKTPFIIEFTGLPNSGKTTLIHNLSKALADSGFRVKIMQEDAELVPKEIPKKTWVRNVWITFGQLQSLLEIPFLEEYDIVLLDRGYYDAMFWANFLYTQDICSKEESNSLIRILEEMAHSFCILPDCLFVINVSVEESLKRRYALSTATSISKPDFLYLYLKELDNFYKLVKSPMKYMDTTGMSISEVTSSAYKMIIDMIA